ncbi:MAG: hypothetical protein DI560_10770 [Pseudomonas putida]|nr:MAG: hypothetical protein DI560_10770 [Pseudomonas putida]
MGRTFLHLSQALLAQHALQFARTFVPMSNGSSAKQQTPNRPHLSFKLLPVSFADLPQVQRQLPPQIAAQLS